MAKLNKLWIVMNPVPGCSFSDICWETTFNKLADYVRGTDRNTLLGQEIAIHDTALTAHDDAVARIKKAIASLDTTLDALKNTDSGKFARR